MTEQLKKLYETLNIAAASLAEARVLDAAQDANGDEINEGLNAVCEARNLCVASMSGDGGTIIAPADAPDRFDSLIRDTLFKASDLAAGAVAFELRRVLESAKASEAKLSELVEIVDSVKDLPDIMSRVEGALDSRPSRVSLQLGWTFWFAVALAVGAWAAVRFGLVTL